MKIDNITGKYLNETKFPKIKTKSDWLTKCREYGYDIYSDVPITDKADVTAWRGDTKVGEWEGKTGRGWIEVPTKKARA